MTHMFPPRPPWTPGDRVDPVPDEPGVILVWDGVPDVVRVPDETPHPTAGQVSRVQDHRVAGCPHPSCEGSHPVHHLHLEGDLFVAGGTVHGWVFYTPTRDL